MKKVLEILLEDFLCKFLDILDIFAKEFPREFRGGIAGQIIKTKKKYGDICQ